MEVCIKRPCLGCADDKMNIFRLLSLGHLSNVVNYINPDNANLDANKVEFKSSCTHILGRAEGTVVL